MYQSPTQTLTQNLFFCHNIARKVQLINFFTRGKKCVSFSRYSDFCVFHESANFKIFDVIMNITDETGKMFDETW